MRKLWMIIGFLILLALPVSAQELEPPEAPPSAQQYMPDDTESFTDGLWYVIKTAIQNLGPSLTEASRACLSVMAVVLLVSLIQSFSGSASAIIELAGTLSIGLILLQPSNALIHLGTKTIGELSEYGKLLLPVMTTAMAAQGGVTSSTALYAGTAIFDAILSSAISKLIVPLLYIYICLSVANSVLGEEILKNFRDFIKWLMTWSLKIILYVFTGYIGITGVVSGATDAAAMKAAKLTISGVVPVVGGILSDASEAILVSAGVLKSAAGVYGLIAMIAMWIGPFLKIGIQYLLLKITAAACSAFGTKQTSSLLQDFAGAMGFILAMIGTVCLMLLISTVCFMKGIA